MTDDTRVTRQRKPSAVEMRAASEVSPQLREAVDVPEGPEQDAILASAFGAGFDLIIGEAKEMAATIERLRGALANAEQGRDLFREQAKRDAKRADEAEKRAELWRARAERAEETLRQMRGGR